MPHSDILNAIRDYAAALERREQRREMDARQSALVVLARQLGPDMAERVFQWSSRGFSIVYTTPPSSLDFRVEGFSAGVKPNLVEHEIDRELDGLRVEQYAIERWIMAAGAEKPADERPQQPDPIDVAIGLLRKDPNRSDRDIAKEAGCSNTKLSRDETYQAVRAAFTADPPAKGAKYKGEIEAESDDDEA